MSGLNGDWYEALKGEFAKPYYRKLFATVNEEDKTRLIFPCLLYTSPSPRDLSTSRMPSSA